MAKRGFGGGMMPGNMNNLLKQAQKMQENMQKMQAELEAKEIESSVGGGAVTVKVNGKKELIDINIKVLTKLTKYFLPKIIECKNGGILNVASTAAFCSGPRMAAYYASKAYVLNLTEAIYEECKDSGIRISCLCPGPVKTTFQDKAGIKKSESAKKYLMDAEEVAKVSYKDFKKGKLIIIPGMKNKLLVIGNKLLPRRISRKIILKTNKK